MGGMSAFEYTSVMASIIIGLALVDVLVSFNRLIRAGKAVRWHWAAPVAAVMVVLALIQVWWSLYSPQGTGLIIGQFLPLLVEMVILFLLSAAALPDEVSADGIDLKAYYHRNGPYFWSLFTGRHYNCHYSCSNKRNAKLAYRLQWIRRTQLGTDKIDR